MRRGGGHRWNTDADFNRHSNRFVDWFFDTAFDPNAPGQDLGSLDNDFQVIVVS